MPPTNKLIYGLGQGLTYSLGQEGRWVPRLEKILASFPNQVLISAFDMPYKLTKEIYRMVGQDRLVLDSGGYSLYKVESKGTKTQEEFEKLVKKAYRKFMKTLEIAKFEQIFELDNEYFRMDEDLMSPKNYCRQEVKDITGFYPTPVFKMNQPFEYWKRLCDSDIYPRLSVGGLAVTRSWHTKREELRTMMNYARQKGKKVHLLGCQNVETFKFVKPDTVDYSLCQFAANMKVAREKYPEETSFERLKLHAGLYAFAKAKSRSFLYDTFKD